MRTIRERETCAYKPRGKGELPTLPSSLSWTHIKPGYGLVAMQVLTQAVLDLEHPKERGDALAFLKGTGEDGILSMWCEHASIDPLSVMAMVRSEPPTLLERIEKKCKGKPEGSEIVATSGEVRAIEKDGAQKIEFGSATQWQWRGYWVVKGREVGRPEAESSTSEVPVGGFSQSNLSGTVAGFCQTFEEEGEEEKWQR